MHPHDVLRYGHLTLMKAIDEFPQDEWETSGACGYWSVKDIVAHLESFERMLAELLYLLVGKEGPTPTLDDYRAGGNFNDRQVAQQQDHSPAEVLAAYRRAYERSQVAVEGLPQDLFERPGALPWYGEEYDLEDFLIYSFYGHKREHSAQIAAYRDRLAA